MPYPTQHENFYKNRIVQLQQQLQQLTEIYNYMLNEVAPPRVLHTIPDTDVPFGGTRFIPNGPNNNPRPYGVNNHTNVYRDPAELAAIEAARAAAYAARMAEFANMTPVEIVRAIDTGGIDFARYVAENYGTIVQVGSSYQRLLPDGTLQVYGANNAWVSINKPGFMSTFGPISANGIVIPMHVWQQGGNGGHWPGDITYTTGRPIGPQYGYSYRDPRLRVPHYPGP